MENSKKFLLVCLLAILIFFFLSWLVWFEFRVPLFSIKDFLIADFNHDSQKELALVVWKKGNFGKTLPFWLKEDDHEYGSHLFIYRFQRGRIVPFWQSSRLEQPICKIRIQNSSTDGVRELIVSEGIYVGKSYNAKYYTKYNCLGTKKTFWRWNGWGFTKI